MSDDQKYQDLSLRLVRLFKGNQSQADLSRKLGSTFNIVNRWETGSRKFYWEDFLQLCALEGIEVETVLEGVTNFTFQANPSGAEVFEKIVGCLDPALLQKSFSTGQLQRLRSGETKLVMADFLQILDLAFGRSPRFFALLFPESDLSRTLQTETVDYIQLAASDINYSLLKQALSLKCYSALESHSSQHLAELLDLNEKQVDDYLQNLISVGVIEMSNNIYRIKEAFVDTRLGGKEASDQILNSLKKRLMQSRELGVVERGRSKSAYLTYPTNAALEEKVFELTNQYYVEVTALIRDEEKKDLKDTIGFLSIDFFYPLKNWPVLKR